MKIIKEIGRNPHIDWFTTILLSSVIAVALAIGGIYLYNAVTRGDIQGTVDMEKDVSQGLDEKAFSAVIKRISEKEDQSKKVKAGYTGPNDPSI